MVNTSVYIRESDTSGWVRALEIPRDDIARLTFWPLKWLRFVAFVAFGAKGELHDGPGRGSDIINYEAVRSESIDLLAPAYYYVSQGTCWYADPRVLLQHQPALTSDLSTDSCDYPGYRACIAARDGNVCVITGAESDFCEAIQIIPHIKRDEFIQVVIMGRKSLYKEQEPHHDLGHIGVNSPENGMFLRIDIFNDFQRGKCVLLKTPNLALDPVDVPRAEAAKASTPTPRTIFQYLKPDPGNKCPVPDNMDVMADWSGADAPLGLLLDYHYGAAAIELWGSESLKSILSSRREETHRSMDNS